MPVEVKRRRVLSLYLSCGAARYTASTECRRLPRVYYFKNHYLLSLPAVRELLRPGFTLVGVTPESIHRHVSSDGGIHLMQTKGRVWVAISRRLRISCTPYIPTDTAS